MLIYEGFPSLIILHLCLSVCHCLSVCTRVYAGVHTCERGDQRRALGIPLLLLSPFLL